MTKNIGGPVGPFNQGQSIFDFLDGNVLNQLSKALAAYKGLSVTAPLSLIRGPQGDAIGLQRRIDNFLLVELQEDLIEDTAAAARVIRRDKDDDFVTSDDLEIEVHDSDIAVGGTGIFATKRWQGQKGIAFQNPYSKNNIWEFLSLEIQQGGTLTNSTTLTILVCPSGGGWHDVPLDTIVGATPGTAFDLASSVVTVSKEGPLKICYKVFVQRSGLGGGASDDSIEAKIIVDDGGGYDDIVHSFTIGLIDDVDIICGDGPPFVEKEFFEGTATCPPFYFNAGAGDKFKLQVQRKAGNAALNILADNTFFTIEYNR